MSKEKLSSFAILLKSIKIEFFTNNDSESSSTTNDAEEETSDSKRIKCFDLTIKNLSIGYLKTNSKTTTKATIQSIDVSCKTPNSQNPLFSLSRDNSDPEIDFSVEKISHSKPLFNWKLDKRNFLSFRLEKSPTTKNLIDLKLSDFHIKIHYPKTDLKKHFETIKNQIELIYKKISNFIQKLRNSIRQNLTEKRPENSEKTTPFLSLPTIRIELENLHLELLKQTDERIAFAFLKSVKFSNLDNLYWNNALRGYLSPRIEFLGGLDGKEDVVSFEWLFDCGKVCFEKKFSADFDKLKIGVYLNKLTKTALLLNIGDLELEKMVNLVGIGKEINIKNQILNFIEKNEVIENFKCLMEKFVPFVNENEAVKKFSEVFLNGIKEFTTKEKSLTIDNCILLFYELFKECSFFAAKEKVNDFIKTKQITLKQTELVKSLTKFKGNHRTFLFANSFDIKETNLEENEEKSIFNSENIFLLVRKEIGLFEGQFSFEKANLKDSNQIKHRTISIFNKNSEEGNEFNLDIKKKKDFIQQQINKVKECLKNLYESEEDMEDINEEKFEEIWLEFPSKDIHNVEKYMEMKKSLVEKDEVIGIYKKQLQEMCGIMANLNEDFNRRKDP